MLKPNEVSSSIGLEYPGSQPRPEPRPLTSQYPLPTWKRVLDVTENSLSDTTKKYKSCTLAVDELQGNLSRVSAELAEVKSMLAVQTSVRIVVRLSWQHAVEL